MRTTLILDEDLFKKAQQLTKIKEKTAIVNLGLKMLVEQYTRERLIALGGSDKKASAPQRRRGS